MSFMREEGVSRFSRLNILETGSRLNMYPFGGRTTKKINAEEET